MLLADYLHKDMVIRNYFFRNQIAILYLNNIKCYRYDENPNTLC